MTTRLLQQAADPSTLKCLPLFPVWNLSITSHCSQEKPLTCSHGLQGLWHLAPHLSHLTSPPFPPCLCLASCSFLLLPEAPTALSVSLLQWFLPAHVLHSCPLLNFSPSLWLVHTRALLGYYFPPKISLVPKCSSLSIFRVLCIFYHAALYIPTSYFLLSYTLFVFIHRSFMDHTSHSSNAQPISIKWSHCVSTERAISW